MLNTPAQLRRGAVSLLPSASGLPVIRSTPRLDTKLVWVDGSASCDWDMPISREWLTAQFAKMASWQEAGGKQLYPSQAGMRAGGAQELGWKRISERGKFWVAGPKQCLVFDMNEHPTEGQLANRMTEGEANLLQTGGKVAWMVGSWFLTREHLAEVRR